MIRKALVNGLSLVLMICTPYGYTQQDSTQNQPIYTTYLTNQVKNNQPVKSDSSEFGCSDRIYGVLEITGLEKIQHDFSVHWFDPTDKQIEVTKFDFKGAYKNRLWSWLQLHAPTGAILGQMFDPSFGMEGFIGQWRVEFKINNETVAKTNFRVLC